MGNLYNLLHDIYYTTEYISLYLKEGEELFDFNYTENGSFLINKTIKRPISKIGSVKVNDGYYDLETAYGYGGFYTNSNDNDFLLRAFEAYSQKCNDEKIIAEFIRFHPYNKFPIESNEFLDFNIHDRDVVIVNLTQDILMSYSSKVRNTIKRSIEKVVIEKSDDLNKFIELYSDTMSKNNADSFYFFSIDLFENLFKLDGLELYSVKHEEETIAMGFFMFGEDLAHYHLSANSDLSYKLNSNYALLHQLFLIAQEKGKKYFILGGGTTSLADDPLLKFKKKFSKETKPFYISGKIYNQDIYDRYIKLWEEQNQLDVKYFLKYRMETQYE